MNSNKFTGLDLKNKKSEKFENSRFSDFLDFVKT